MSFPFSLVAPKRRKLLSLETIEKLVTEAEEELTANNPDLEEANVLARKAGLSIESDLPAILNSHKNGINSVAFTAGHSNTDHVVVVTGDYTTDRVAELRRNLITRSRAQQPESKGEYRWDKPRAPGERRRRIIREKDLPAAPPEPCQSGYIVFVSQMTAKVRHDRPLETHDQTKCIQEISKMWRMGLTDAEREYYNKFSEESKSEYRKQSMEFRATGYYPPSETFEKIPGSGVWVRKKWSEKNALEREIAGYDTVIFPPRPKFLDEEYKKREQERIEKRKMQRKLQRLALLEKGIKPFRNGKLTTANSNDGENEHDDDDENNTEDRIIDPDENDTAVHLESERDEISKKTKTRKRSRAGKKTRIGEKGHDEKNSVVDQGRNDTTVLSESGRNETAKKTKPVKNAKTGKESKSDIINPKVTSVTNEAEYY